MQDTSAIYGKLLRNAYHEKEIRVFIEDTEYRDDQIVSFQRSSDLYADGRPGVGGATAREIDLILRQPSGIPRTAKIRPEVRLVLKDWISGEVTDASEWIPQGMFFTDTRSEDHGDFTIHGYDAMLKAEQPYLGSTINDSWPQKAPAVAAAIAQRMGLTLDPRSVIAADDVPMPLDLTMREVLSDIAAANAGNWTVTDTGTLRLVPLRSIPSSTGYLVTEDGDAITLGGVRLKVSSGTGTTGAADGQKTYVGLAAQTLEVSPALPAYTGVTLEDADGVQYSAGNATGMVLTAYCSWATQAMAERVLTAIKGYAYRPFSAACAVLDPAAELGDGVTVGGVYSVLAASVATFDGLLHADISAPSEDELDHEYPYETPEQRSMKRGFKAVYSTIEKTDTAIRMEVGELSGKYAALSLTVVGFTVTDASGTTRIKGSSIETDTLYVNAANIDGTLKVEQINLTGSISWDDLDSGVQSEINNAGGISASYAKTLITGTLVASPRIVGAEVIGGTLKASDETAELVITNTGIEYYKGGYRDWRLVEITTATGYRRLQLDTSVYEMGLSLGAGGDIDIEAESRVNIRGLTGGVYFTGEVDFADATVTGLDVTATAVWG